MTAPTPSQDDVERVARAICISEGMDPDEVNGLLIINRPGERPNWEGFEDTARAAIAAMPTFNDGLEEAARIIEQKHTNNVGMVHPMAESDAKAIRARKKT